MATFYESERNPIASELVRQGFTLDRGEALRIINIDEKASETDTAIAIGTAAISLVAACGTLALSGFTLPILAPLAALGYAGLTAWNSRATKQEREFEADFLHNHPEFIEAVNQKLKAGEESDRVAAAYEHTLKAFIEGDAKRMQSFMPIATSPIGTATKLGAIEVNQPTSDEVKEVGSGLCDRLAGQKTVLEQIARRVAAQDIQGGLKMAIEGAGLTPASFVEQFPGKGHVYDWAAGAIAAVIPSSEKAQTIGEFIDSTKPDRDVESAVKQAQSVTVPTKADILKMPLPDRADYILKLLAEYGCDLRNLIGRPTLAAGGLQRSGKTTLILLLGILEKAKGQKLYYISRDSDLSPVAFDGYANGSINNAVAALGVLSKTINSGSMGSLSGQTWVLDEFSSTAKELDEKTRSDFWGMALTGFAKQGGRVRFIVHHKTAGANGIPKGEAETFKAEVKMFWTDRTEMSDGTYQPSGQYELLQEVNGYYKESGQTFQIPEWLLTETNPAWNNAPCPVRSLLLFFPEFDTRKGAIAHPLNESKPKDPFQSTQVVSAQPATQSEPTDNPWEDYEIHTKQMNIEAMLPNPKIDKLISDLQKSSSDARSPAFISWLETLRTGQSIDETTIDPQFVGIARHRKIISKEGVVI